MRTVARIVIFVLGILTVPLPGDAQQAGKVHRIGFILTAAPEEVVHLKTAQALGLTIPQSVLIRADHVIQ